MDIVFTEDVDNIKVDNITNRVITEATYILVGTKGSVNDVCKRRVVFNKKESVYIDFEDLTKELVLRWLENELGPNEIKAMKIGIEAKLKLATEKPIEVDAPWAGE